MPSTMRSPPMVRADNRCRSGQDAPTPEMFGLANTHRPVPVKINSFCSVCGMLHELFKTNSHIISTVLGMERAARRTHEITLNRHQTYSAILRNSAKLSVVGVFAIFTNLVFATEAEDEQILGLWKSDQDCFVHIYQTDDDQLGGAAWGRQKESGELSLEVGNDRRFPWVRRTKKLSIGEQGQLEPKRRGRFIINFGDRSVLHSDFSPCFIKKGIAPRWRRVDDPTVFETIVPRWHVSSFRKSITEDDKVIVEAMSKALKEVPREVEISPSVEAPKLKNITESKVFSGPDLDELQNENERLKRNIAILNVENKELKRQLDNATSAVARLNAYYSDTKAFLPETKALIQKQHSAKDKRKETQAKAGLGVALGYRNIKVGITKNVFDSLNVCKKEWRKLKCYENPGWSFRLNWGSENPDPDDVLQGLTIDLGQHTEATFLQFKDSLRDKYRVVYEYSEEDWERFTTERLAHTPKQLTFGLGPKIYTGFEEGQVWLNINSHYCASISQGECIFVPGMELQYLNKEWGRALLKKVAGSRLNPDDL